MTLVHIEAAADLGITSRVLDLLSAQDSFPRTFSLSREADRITIRFDLDPAVSEREPKIIAKIRQIPGVHRAGALATEASRAGLAS